jgi:tRNA dimethylallyltransferase
MSTHHSPKSSGDRPPVALIAGPTASGKSDLAVRLALVLTERGQSGVVVNADSAQVYADLRVLSARPSDDEMRGVEHRLFGTWDGAKPCSAADWARAARDTIADVHSAGGVPILVGGTGLYIRTLIDGIAAVPPIDPAIRERVRALEPAVAYGALHAEDPERAAALHANDRLRIARALEVVRSTGRPLAYWQKTDASGIGNAVTLHPVILQPPLAILRERTARRFSRMLDSGAVEEVRALLDRRLDSELPVMRAIGVSEVAGWITGLWSREEAEARGQRATWQYVRRQMTWLRAQPPGEWTRADTESFDEESLFAALLRH